jgi:hypothetical protein
MARSVMILLERVHTVWHYEYFRYKYRLVSSTPVDVVAQTVQCRTIVVTSRRLRGVTSEGGDKSRLAIDR